MINDNDTVNLFLFWWHSLIRRQLGWQWHLLKLLYESCWWSGRLIVSYFAAHTHFFNNFKCLFSIFILMLTGLRWQKKTAWKLMSTECMYTKNCKNIVIWNNKINSVWSATSFVFILLFYLCKHSKLEFVCVFLSYDV